MGSKKRPGRLCTAHEGGLVRSGFTILEEQELTLELGLPAVLFTVQTPDTQVVYLVTALKDQYLVISGEGNLDLVKQIVERLRPIS